MKLAPARLVALALMLCFGAVFGIAKEPEPDAAAVKKEQDYIKQVYATDYKRLPADGRSFCEKLVNAAKEEKNPTRKYALLLEAASAALGDCDCDLAMTAVDARAKDFEINSLKARSDLLKGLSENMAVVGKDLDFRRSLFIHAIETSQRAVAEDALEVADDAASAAQIFARAITQNIRKDAMEGMEKQGIAKKILEAVKKRKSHQLTFKKDQETLKEHPDDPAANLRVGRYLCFVLGKREGLLNLAKSDIQTIAELAKEELAIHEAKPPNAELLCAVAEKWWGLAKAKKVQRLTQQMESELMKHAVDLYRSVPVNKMAAMTQQLAKNRAREWVKEDPLGWQDGFYKHYRLVATKSSPSGVNGWYAEIEFVDAETGRFLQDGKPAASKPKDDPKEAAAKAALAFDCNLNTGYETDSEPGKNREWIQYSVEEPVRLKSVKIVQYVHDTHRVFEMDLLGSNDGLSWMRIKSLKNLLHTSEVELFMPIGP